MPRSTTRTKKQSPKRLRHSLKHAVVPHASNQFHPHLIRPKGISLVLLIVAALVGFSHWERPVVLGQKTDVTQERLLAATNEAREGGEVSPLVLNEKLSAAATLKAQDMLHDQYWAHVAPDGTTPWEWFKRSGYVYGVAGENLARGFQTASGVTTAWMNSPQHRANLLNPDYKDVGFAVISGELDGERTNVVVAMYGAQKDDAVAQTAVLAATGSDMGLLTRLGVGLQSLTPAALASFVLLLTVAFIALVAHAYRRRLPLGMQRSWRRHHGLYKAVGMTSLAIVVVALYGGGQI